MQVSHHDELYADNDERNEPPHPLCQYVYSFDWPDLTSHGTLNITQNVIAVHFPQKPCIYPYSPTDKNNIPEVILKVSEQVLFSYAWLPIASYYDLNKCHDMLTRMAYYFFKCDPAWQPTTSFVKYYDKQNTFQKNSDYTLNCQESYLQVLIDLKILSSHSHPVRQGPHIEIHIGSYLVFSSKRDLKGLSTSSFNDVLNYILRKIANL